MHWAVIVGDLQILEQVVYTVPLNAKNNQGKRALALVAETGLGTVFNWLFKASTDIYTLDNSPDSILNHDC